MSRLSIIRELFIFMKQNKKWWLAPIILILLLLGTFMIIGQSAPVIAPIIYTVF